MDPFPIIPMGLSNKDNFEIVTRVTKKPPKASDVEKLTPQLAGLKIYMVNVKEVEDSDLSDQMLTKKFPGPRETLLECLQKIFILN